LHRAFSVFLFDDIGRTLIQQRAIAKYHSGGRWANSCCGHPRPAEPTRDAALRRVGEELGATAAIEYVGSFVYCADVGRGLIEHELDHVFVGRLTSPLKPDPREIADWRWISPSELRLDLARRPLHYAVWLKAALGIAKGKFGVKR
jgi:isopentenyl-diphosphate delta-isomerase